jgi:hypothetical protein
VALAGCGSKAEPPREVPFTLVATEGRTLRLEVQAGGPPCDAVLGAHVDETPTTVTVTVRAGQEPGAKCGPGVVAMIGTFPVQARLREPLGTRTLKDGAR